MALIEKLLGDASCMVIGSAVSAFQEVCPDNWDVIHPAFRRLCHLLADLDEWAQVRLVVRLLGDGVYSDRRSSGRERERARAPC